MIEPSWRQRSHSARRTGERDEHQAALRGCRGLSVAGHQAAVVNHISLPHAVIQHERIWSRGSGRRWRCPERAGSPACEATSELSHGTIGQTHRCAGSAAVHSASAVGAWAARPGCRRARPQAGNHRPVSALHTPLRRQLGIEQQICSVGWGEGRPGASRRRLQRGRLGLSAPGESSGGDPLAGHARQELDGRPFGVDAAARLEAGLLRK